MVIIDAPFVSEPLLEWLADSQHPVLGNAFATALESDRSLGLNLVDAVEAAARVNAGERVYTNTENALEWLLENTDNEPMKKTIRLFKDKAAMRDRLAGLDPDLFFATFGRDELTKVDASSLPLPVVLKPAVGFCSMGVYVIEDAKDWQRALADIERCEAQWHERYPESVVGGETYLVESYLTGQEYAVDAYYDEQGKAHVLNVLRHDFASTDDTSDRMYLTSAAIVGEMAAPLEAWLDAANEVVGARNFPVHVEVRAEADDAGGVRIAPIEFNPLRFAGLGGTDVALYGMGLRTYQAYLEDAPVDLPQLFEGRGQDAFVMSLLNPAPEADLSRPFDYDAFEARFTNVLSLHRFDPNVTGSYGFLFLRTSPSTADELDFLLHTDLTEFI